MDFFGGNVRWHRLTIKDFIVRIFLTVFIVFLSSHLYAEPRCSGDDYLRLTSGVFDLCLPLSFYKNATVGPGGGIVTRLANGSGFSIQIFLPSMDSLPENFDMRLYPEYVLGLRPVKGLNEEQAEKFKRTAEIFKSPELEKIPLQKYKKNGKTFYWSSKDKYAIGAAFVVLDEVSDQVLFFTFQRMDEKLQQTILNGVQ